MRRRFASATAIIGLLAGMLAGAGAAGAQVPDFTISPTSGPSGTTVTGNVNPELIAENCLVASDPEDVDAVQAHFTALFGAYQPYLASITEAPVDTLEELAGAGFNLALLGIAGILGDENTIEYMGNTYVLTFIDLGTTEPIGERSTFDPTSGVGQVVAPDVDPGLYGVAATCVEPVLTDEAFAEAIAAGVEALIAEYGDLAGALEANATAPLDVARLMAESMLPPMMVPMDGARWVQQFTIPAPPVPLTPDQEAFCGVLPELSPLGDEILDALAALPEDDAELSLEDWAALADWDDVGAELEALIEELEALLAIGDETRPDALAPQWEIATTALRQLRDALRAVDFDLSGEVGRTIAGQLRAAATAEGEDPAVVAAIGVLTDYFLTTCVQSASPGTPTPVTPVGTGSTPTATPRAAAATPVTAQPTYTG